MKSGIKFSNIVVERNDEMDWIAFLLDLLKVLGGFIAGAVAGFFIARNYMKKYMKKNPPINEQMIRAMMSQMGRTPSQKQVNQMMKTVTKNM